MTTGKPMASAAATASWAFTTREWGTRTPNAARAALPSGSVRERAGAEAEIDAEAAGGAEADAEASDDADHEADAEATAEAGADDDAAADEPDADAGVLNATPPPVDQASPTAAARSSASRA
jgi:hypothetical protein